MIDFQDGDSGATIGSDTLKDGAVPTEMVFPKIAARMKKTNDLPGFRVDPGYVRAFRAIAIKTRKCKIIFTSRAAMLPCDDVIDFKRNRRSLLEKATVFTTPMRSITNV